MTISANGYCYIHSVHLDWSRHDRLGSAEGRLAMEVWIMAAGFVVAVLAIGAFVGWLAWIIWMAIKGGEE